MTREEAIKRLEDTFEGWNMWVVDNDSPASKMSKALDMAIAALREQESAENAHCNSCKKCNGWIPVTERLPEDRNEVLVHTTKKVSKARFGDGRWHGSGGCWMNVTHWMPLPEPPKEEV